jgi:phenylpropionate dioxygenase-like ring-hydroxylating dioxygenase large terminal subunit
MQSTIAVSQLLRTDEVHQSIYTDPAIFDREMDMIFGKAWIYVGHDSQIPRAGDYITARIGKQSVIMVRDKSGAIHVLYNRCPHKAAKLVPEGSCGHVRKLFRCPYHAWTFQHDGTLCAVPFSKRYEGTGFDSADPRFSMPHVARVASYRGFVFASLSPDGPDLATFLGGVISSLENFCDRAPEGKVAVAGGVFRVLQRSNWKIFLENLNDTAHAQATHESSFVAARHTAQARGAEKLPFELHIIEGNGEPNSFWEQIEWSGFDYGHSYMTSIFNAPQDELSMAYRASLEKAYGAERAVSILATSRHNTTIYPSCSPHTSFQQLRVIRPLAVDRTLVEIFTFRLLGAPEGLFQRTLTYSNVVNSPSSVVMVDDVDLYNRVHEGMANETGQWVSQHRRAGFEETVGGEIKADGVSEMPIRNQFTAWKRYMSGEV